MRPTVCAASAAIVILAAAGSPAGAAEDKSTKPRIAVIEFKNKADSKLEVESWFWGTSAPAGMEMNSWLEAAQAGQMSTDRKQPKSQPKMLAPGATRPQRGSVQQDTGGDPDRPIVTGRLPNPAGPTSAPEAGDEVMVAMEHGDSASGQATGKRQHKPITITKEWDAATPQLMKLDRPAAKGSVTLRLAQPWDGCAVGDRFNGVYLTTGVTHKYRLDGAEIVGCGGSTVTINYTRFAASGEPVR